MNGVDWKRATSHPQDVSVLDARAATLDPRASVAPASRVLSSASRYADPYLCGVSLGLVLLGAFVFAGRGLGASGAFAAAASGGVAAVAPHYAAANGYFSRYLSDPGGPWHNWLLFEIAGVCIGGFVSAALAGRLHGSVERGSGVTMASRLTLGFAGGAVMGLGAVLARGCTSGQALTGGALLSVGSWGFIGCAFAAAYLVSPLLKGSWR